MPFHRRYQVDGIISRTRVTGSILRLQFHYKQDKRFVIFSCFTVDQACRLPISSTT